MVAAVAVSAAGSNQQTLAVSPQQERIIRLVAMRLCAERAGFEDDLDAVSRIGQAGVQIGLAGSAK